MKILQSLSILLVNQASMVAFNCISKFPTNSMEQVQSTDFPARSGVETDRNIKCPADFG